MEKRKKILTIIHVMVWLLLFSLPFLFEFQEKEWSIAKALNPIVLLGFTMLVFYLNFFVFIDKFLFTRKLWLYFLSNILTYVVFIIVIDVLYQHVLIHILPPPRMRLPINFRQLMMYRNILTFSLVAGLSVAIKMTGYWYQSEAEKKELEKLHLESEISNLKHQLNPHFLFNTMNNIYSLIAINQDNAQQAVHQLSNLIRYVLYDSDQAKVSLKKELNFLHNYIQLMSLRIPENVKLTIDIEDPDYDVQIAPLLFIPLIENAFKHGISPTEPSFISIKFELNLDNEIVYTVENSSYPKTYTDKSGSGIGLANLKKRLQLIYPSRYELMLEDQVKTYRAGLKIKI